MIQKSDFRKPTVTHDIIILNRTVFCLFKVGHSVLQRTNRGKALPSNSRKKLRVLRKQLPIIESVMKCIEMNWMAIIVSSLADYGNQSWNNNHHDDYFIASDSHRFFCGSYPTFFLSMAF